MHGQKVDKAPPRATTSRGRPALEWADRIQTLRAGRAYRFEKPYHASYMVTAMKRRFPEHHFQSYRAADGFYYVALIDD